MEREVRALKTSPGPKKMGLRGRLGPLPVLKGRAGSKH